MERVSDERLKELIAKHERNSAATGFCRDTTEALRELLSYRAQWVSGREPEREGRYLIQYRQCGQVRVFVGDFIPGHGWSCGLADMEVLKWREIPTPSTKASNV